MSTKQSDADARKSSAVKQSGKEPKVWFDAATKDDKVKAAQKRLNSNDNLAYWQAVEYQKVIDSNGEYKPKF